MQSLATITDPMGVKPEALRVALHRLRKDGWIDSKRQGRSSHYHLTEFGREQSATAAKRIYRIGPPDDSGWYLVVASSSSAASQREIEEITTARESVVLSANASLLEGHPVPSTSDLLWSRLDYNNIPNWVRTAAIGPDTVRDYAALLKAFSSVADVSADDLTPFEIATLRTLIVHSWRRVLLRHPDIPNALLPSDCALADCREVLNHLLTLLPRERTAEIKSD